jgi:hypothetical protein
MDYECWPERERFMALDRAISACVEPRPDDKVKLKEAFPAAKVEVYAEAMHRRCIVSFRQECATRE